MTYRDKVKENDPNQINPKVDGGVFGCPYHYDYIKETRDRCGAFCNYNYYGDKEECEKCWTQEFKEVSNEQ